MSISPRGANFSDFGGRLLLSIEVWKVYREIYISLVSFGPILYTKFYIDFYFDCREILCVENCGAGEML